MTFKGKTVVITGGARGIGYAIASSFLKNGATVHILDKSFPESFHTDDDEHCISFSGDVSNSADVKDFILEVIKKNGRIDVLVNNAGIIRDNVIWKMTEEDFDAVLNVNLKGCWLISKEVSIIMRKQQYGRIVNIASRGWLGSFGQSNYSASKGGLVSLTRVLALELAKSNVTVNAIAPGFIDTPMTRSLPPETFKKLVDAQPGKKTGTPEDIASAVIFLASNEAGFINGQVLHVDGGRSIGSTVF